MTNRKSVSYRQVGLAILLCVVAPVLGAGAELTRYAGTATSYPWAWANPSSATGEPDGKCATTGLPNKEMVLSSFGLSVPRGATITGVRVEIKGGRDSGGFFIVSLSSGMTPVGIPKIVPTSVPSDCAGTTFLAAGGEGDLWGLPELTSATANSSSFGILVSSGFASCKRMIDSVRVTVFYQVPEYATIELAANPSGGGEVTGGGTYPVGSPVTVRAVASRGYRFLHWTEGAAVVSIDPDYAFTVSADRTLVAHFRHEGGGSDPEVRISVRAEPAAGGMVSGGGDYVQGGQACVVATANAGYRFSKWTEGATDVSHDATYCFVATAARDLVAHFAQDTGCPGALLHKDFEDLTGWSKTGLWHLRSADGTTCFSCAPLAGRVAHYARPLPACDYATGNRTVGYLTSPTLNITGIRRIELRFDYLRHVESFSAASRDQTYVQVRLGSGAWRTVWTRDSRHPSPECATATVVFDTGGARTLIIRFVFDSVNSISNVYPGWAVDNLCVREAPVGQPLTVLPVEESRPAGEPDSEITVGNHPNPVRDIHTTTFRVLGAQADFLRIEIYDLTGRLVWKGESAGADIVWHTDDLAGLPLANGVYLYRAFVRLDGNWVSLAPQKVTILR